MTALVTGANGLLGNRLVEILLGRGESVRAMVRRGRTLPSFSRRSAERIEADLTDPESLRAAVAGVSVIYHCAALSSDWGARRDFHAVNVAGTRNLLTAAAASNVDLFVHVSSTDVYGYPRIPCDEGHGFRDVGLPYNSSKILGERAVWEWHREFGLPVTVLRPATIYGPRNANLVVEAADLITAGKFVLINGGRHGAGLIYVDDAVEAMIAAASLGASVGHAYNLRHPDDVTWREYFAALAAALGHSDTFRTVSRRTAWPAAFACEIAYSALKRSTRPLLTRHAVNLLSRDQNFPIGRIARDLNVAPRVTLAEGMSRIQRWLAEGRP